MAHVATYYAVSHSLLITAEMSCIINYNVLTEKVMYIEYKISQFASVVGRIKDRFD